MLRTKTQCTVNSKFRVSLLSNQLSNENEFKSFIKHDLVRY